MLPCFVLSSGVARNPVTRMGPAGSLQYQLPMELVSDAPFHAVWSRGMMMRVIHARVRHVVKTTMTMDGGQTGVMVKGRIPE